MTHLQLDLGGDRDGATGVGDPLPLVLTEVAAVDERGVRAQQTEPVQLLHHREPAGHPAHRDVDGERDAQLACQPPLGLDHLVLGEARAAGGQRHREQAVVGGEIGIPDPPDVVARDGLGAEEPVLLQRRVGTAVRVLGPDPGLLQALIAASGCSGVLLMCDQSTSVVMPAFRHSSDPARLLA